MYLSLLATAAKNENQGSIWPTLILMALIFGAMYFLMIRPQRKRMRESQQMQSRMGEGDEIITNSGIYGFITAVDGDVLWVEIAENVEIRLARSAVLRVVEGSPANAAAADDATDDDNDNA